MKKNFIRWAIGFGVVFLLLIPIDITLYSKFVISFASGYLLGLLNTIYLNMPDKEKKETKEEV